MAASGSEQKFEGGKVLFGDFSRRIKTKRPVLLLAV
jgi:hypothetical protein